MFGNVYRRLVVLPWTENAAFQNLNVNDFYAGRHIWLKNSRVQQMIVQVYRKGRRSRMFLGGKYHRLLELSLIDQRDNLLDHLFR